MGETGGKLAASSIHREAFFGSGDKWSYFCLVVSNMVDVNHPIWDYDPNWLIISDPVICYGLTPLSMCQFGSENMVPLQPLVNHGYSTDSPYFLVAILWVCTIFRHTHRNFWLVVWNIFIFPNSWDNDPIWLIFFKGVETTNQICMYDSWHAVSNREQGSVAVVVSCKTYGRFSRVSRVSQDSLELLFGAIWRLDICFLSPLGSQYPILGQLDLDVGQEIPIVTPDILGYCEPPAEHWTAIASCGKNFVLIFIFQEFEHPGEACPFATTLCIRTLTLWTRSSSMELGLRWPTGDRM